MKRVVVSVLAVLLVLSGVAFASEKGSYSAQGKKAGDSNKAGVQKVMLEYIHNKTSGANAYDIDGVAAKFDYLHSGVKEKGGYYVSCADFKAGNNVYDIDYYVKKEDGEFEVEKEVLHKKNDKVVNKVLYYEYEKKGSVYKHKGSGHEEHEMKGSGKEKKGSDHH